MNTVHLHRLARIAPNWCTLDHLPNYHQISFMWSFLHVSSVYYVDNSTIYYYKSGKKVYLNYNDPDFAVRFDSFIKSELSQFTYCAITGGVVLAIAFVAMWL